MQKKREYKIYLIHCKIINFYKIGISVNPQKRLKQLQTGTPYELSVVYIHESKFPFKVEKILHNSLSSKKVTENYKYDFEKLKGEWFDLSAGDILSFKQNCVKIEGLIENLKKSGNPFV